jgi:BCCT family betaine/carnitine transporter
MLGLFVARISRGRTIRQLVVGEIVWGSLGCAVFYWIWGSYALHLETSGSLDISAALDGSGIPGAVVAVLASLPGSFAITLLFTLLCFIFLATTLDSAAYVITSICTRDLPGDAEPARWNRLCWAGVLALVAIGLLGVGGVKAAQTSTVIVALPLLPILIVLTLSLLRWLRADARVTSDLPPGSSRSGSARSESALESRGP